MPQNRTELGLDIEAGLREAHRRGDLASRHIEVMPAARVKEIRKSVAKSTKALKRRIPARTVED